MTIPALRSPSSRPRISKRKRTVLIAMRTRVLAVEWPERQSIELNPCELARRVGVCLGLAPCEFGCRCALVSDILVCEIVD